MSTNLRNLTAEALTILAGCPTIEQKQAACRRGPGVFSIALWNRICQLSKVWAYEELDGRVKAQEIEYGVR